MSTPTPRHKQIFLIVTVFALNVIFYILPVLKPIVLTMIGTESPSDLQYWMRLSAAARYSLRQRLTST